MITPELEFNPLPVMLTRIDSFFNENPAFFNSEIASLYQRTVMSI